LLIEDTHSKQSNYILASGLARITNPRQQTAKFCFGTDYKSAPAWLQICASHGVAMHDIQELR
jgi:hypothetical protein